MMWYARVLCHHPYAVLSSVVVVIGTCLVLSLTAKPLPSFNDPALGFEARGTVIGQRQTAWENLLEATEPRGPLTVNPLGDPYYKPKKKDLDKNVKHTHKVCIEVPSDGPVEVLENCTETDNKTRSDLSPTEETSLDTLRNIENSEGYSQDEDEDEYSFDYHWPEMEVAEQNHASEEHGHVHVGPDGFFCNSLVPEYGHVVVESTRSWDNLFSLSNLRSICKIDLKMRAAAMTDICEFSKRNVCCPSWTLPNYVAMLSNKTSCTEINAKDVTRVRRLLRRCVRFFDMQLEKGCGRSECRHVPKVCTEHDSVYTILHYLTDAAFLQPKASGIDPRVHSPVNSKTNVANMKPPRVHYSSGGPYATRGSQDNSRGPHHANPTIKVKTRPMPLPPPLKQPPNVYPDRIRHSGRPLKPPGKPVGYSGHSKHHLQHLGQRRQEDRLSLSSIFLPIARSSAAMPFFERLEKLDLSNGNVTVVGMDLGLKNTLFDKLLLSDSYLLGAGGGVVIILIWFYTGSLFITVITITSVACSLLIAYFLYVFIYEIPFFPYMNILTAVIAIGLGADDTFVYCRVWSLAKQDKDCNSVVKLVSESMNHAAGSICVTSITTAAAFLASCTSAITAVKCFSIFAGTVVIANLILMVTWVPACVVIAERWGANFCCLCVPPNSSNSEDRSPACEKACSIPLKICKKYSEVGKVFFERVLPVVIVKPRHMWIVLFGGIAVGAGIVVFYHPGLRLPDTQDFQLFDRNHYFERYEMSYKYKFWFERNLRRDIVNRLPIRIVWGIKPVDNGDYLDPASKGTLVLDDSFDMSAPESQVWLLEFCRKLRNQTFYMSTLGPLLPNCFVETFKISMERRCKDPNGANRYPCCEASQFPFRREVFDQCIHEGISELYQTPREFFIPGVAGPKFSKEDGKMKAAVVEYDSTYIWSLSHSAMNDFFTKVDTWVSKQMETAPPGLRNGWFTSFLAFYDVQQSLSVGTGLAVAVAVSVCLAVLLLTTLNFVVSVLAVISIGAVMVVTLGALVLLGWRLNVLESVTVSVAIGLAVDLTLHYGVAYRYSPEAERHSAVVWAVGRLGSPVFIAALTSICAGVAMIPARVLAYVHVGTFLTILTISSYVYSTFFYLPLLRIFGPERGFGQLKYPKLELVPCPTDADCCCCPRKEETTRAADKTVYQQAFMSESTLSTSSNCCPNPSLQTQLASGDSHELEPLNTRGGSLKMSVNKRHSSVSRVSSAGAENPLHHNGGPGSFRKSVRSGSTSSALNARRGAKPLRKISLPSNNDRDGKHASLQATPRHSVTSQSKKSTPENSPSLLVGVNPYADFAETQSAIPMGQHLAMPYLVSAQRPPISPSYVTSQQCPPLNFGHQLLHDSPKKDTAIV